MARYVGLIAGLTVAAILLIALTARAHAQAIICPMDFSTMERVCVIETPEMVRDNMIGVGVTLLVAVGVVALYIGCFRDPGGWGDATDPGSISDACRRSDEWKKSRRRS